MKKNVWIGGCLDEYLRKDIISNNGKIMSSYISQMNIIQGLENNSDIIFDSINSLRIDAYPKYKKLFIKRHEWSHKAGAKDVYVSYLNLKYFSIFFKTITLKREAKKWAKNNKDYDVDVYVFGMHSPFMKAALMIKKIIPSARLILINPDLPQFMSHYNSIIKRILKKIDCKQIYKMFKKYDKHILYSKHMAEYLNIDKKDWIVMEGSIDSNDFKILEKKQENEKIKILYSGVIGTMYGTLNLVDAIKKLGDNYELWLFGSGDLENQITEISSKNTSIKYYGYCGDRDYLLQKQRDADILITLINPNEPVSNYCFPSKIFEYLLSGNPVISTKINGIPSEYFDFLFPIADTSVDSIAEAIMKIANMDIEKRELIGAAGRDFVLNYKNTDVQMKKILDFLNK